jgi:UDP-N-acetyl-D-mannosaminuronic acid dehydrogenase
MPSALHLKSEEIDTNEKRGKYTVNIIGCEEKGILYAMAFAKAGFKVICTDADQALAKRLAKGKTMFFDKEVDSKLKSFLRRGQLSVTSELKNAVSQSDIIVMTLTAKIDDNKHADYSQVENTCKQIGMALSRGALFIYGGIASVGFTEGIIKVTLENTSGLRLGEDFGLVYNPLQFFNGYRSASIANQELKVAAMDGSSLDSAVKVLGVLTRKGVKRISDVKVAEAALLFTIIKQDVNLALANELAIFCEKAGMDYCEAVKLGDIHEAYFSPTVEADNCDRNQVYLLLESAENLNVKLRLPALARKVNEDMIRHAINLTKNALRSCGKTLRRAKVAVLGSAKPKTAATVFAKMLEKRGTKVSLYDPLLSKNDLANMARVVKRSMREAMECADCIVILADQEHFKRLNFRQIQAVMKLPAVIVDLTGTVEPKKVERKGFTHCGLGKGASKK